MAWNPHSILAGAGGLSLMLLLAGCSFKATFKETTDTTSNITGTTSGRIWWNEDGLLKAEHKLAAFTAYTAQNLEADAARGKGDYLDSLGTLAHLPDAQALNATSQDVFSRWIRGGQGSTADLVQALLSAQR